MSDTSALDDKDFQCTCGHSYDGTDESRVAECRKAIRKAMGK